MNKNQKEILELDSEINQFIPSVGALQRSLRIQKKDSMLLPVTSQVDDIMMNAHQQKKIHNDDVDEIFYQSNLKQSSTCNKDQPSTQKISKIKSINNNSSTNKKRQSQVSILNYSNNNNKNNINENDTSFEQIILATPTPCQLHPQKPLQIVCISHKVIICSHCAIFGQHKNHILEPLTKVYTKMQKKKFQLKKIFQKSHQILQTTQMNCKTQNNFKLKIKQNQRNSLQKLSQAYIKIHSMLDTQQKIQQFDIIEYYKMLNDKVQKMFSNNNNNNNHHHHQLNNSTLKINQYYKWQKEAKQIVQQLQQFTNITNIKQLNQQPQPQPQSLLKHFNTKKQIQGKQLLNNVINQFENNINMAQRMLKEFKIIISDQSTVERLLSKLIKLQYEGKGRSVCCQKSIRSKSNRNKQCIYDNDVDVDQVNKSKRNNHNHNHKKFMNSPSKHQIKTTISNKNIIVSTTANSKKLLQNRQFLHSPSSHHQIVKSKSPNQKHHQQLIKKLCTPQTTQTTQTTKTIQVSRIRSQNGIQKKQRQNDFKYDNNKDENGDDINKSILKTNHYNGYNVDKVYYNTVKKSRKKNEDEYVDDKNKRRYNRNINSYNDDDDDDSSSLNNQSNILSLLTNNPLSSSPLASKTTTRVSRCKSIGSKTDKNLLMTFVTPSSKVHHIDDHLSDIIKEFIQAPNSTNTLDLSKCQLDDDQAVYYVQKASKNKDIKTLKLCHNKITSNGFHRLIPFIKNCNQLNLSNNLLDQRVFDILQKKISRIKQIKLLNFTNNSLNKVELKHRQKVQELCNKETGLVMLW